MAQIPTTTDGFDVARLPDTSATRRAVNVLVVSSVALAFISFWRAAAIVLCDLASTAYYIGGISEQAIGKAAPWFILGVMLFSYAVRAVYVESCTMFTRGGVYRVVKDAIGGGLAKLSVSALMFDYILTGPISAVAAGQYMVGLFIDMLNLGLRHFGHPPIDTTVLSVQHLRNAATVILAIFITLYFWRANIVGIHESSDKALRIMQLTTVMGVFIIGWSILTIFLRHIPIQMPPLHPVFTDTGIGGNESSKGWLEAFPKLVGALGILVAFGHTLLAMSGEESLAQVNREIEAPKLKNLLRAGFVIFLYSMLLTSLISFFAIFIIPDGWRVKTMVVLNNHPAAVQGKDYVEVDYLRKHDSTHAHDWGLQVDRITDSKGEVHVVPTGKTVELDAGHHVQRDDGGYRDNLINGLVQFLSGPPILKIIMECFVVTVGFLILAGAVNTSMVGSNGVLNRLAEDGVLTPWFQHPHPRFGTTHRLINLIMILQLVVIVASFGDVDTLGEAYAFGVIWSFVFMTMSMAFLRFKDRSARQYRVPLNIHKHDKRGEIDIPIGIFAVFLILASTALINLLTKKTATIWGVGFTVAFLAVFIIVEHISHRRHGGKHEHLEQFNERSSDGVSIEALGLKHPKPVLVAAHGPRSLPVLQRVLQEIDTNVRDVVVVTCKVIPARTLGVSPEDTRVDDNDRDLLTKIVTVAEQVGKEVHPLVLPTNNPLFAIATAARDLKANEIVLGVSEKMHAETQLEQFALAWGSATADPMYADIAHDMTVRIVGPRLKCATRWIEIGLKTMTFKEAFHLALQNLEAGNLVQAENICRQILQQRPGDPNALHLLGAVVHQTGRLNLAVDLIYRAAQADPRRPDVFNNLGAALNDLGRIDDAIVAYRHALRLDPHYAEAYNNLAISLCGKGLISESIDASRRAIQLKPDYAQAHGNLAGALAGAGRLDESFAVFENAFALAPDNWSIRSNYLFMLPFHPAMSQGDILKKCLQWNDQFAAPLGGQIKPHANDRDPNRRLRIGYVSPDFRDHCQSFFMIPLLSAHDHGQYEIYCYSSVGHADATTERIRLLADAWRDVARQSDAAVAEAIRSDRIDILVDLTMHMARGRPLLFAHKPAPVQIAWLAYPGTTGISAIDYRFSDPYLDPPENGGADYSEKTVTLPDTFWCYDPLTTEPQVGPLPAVENGYITFGCLNNFCKINRGVLELWAKVLTAVDRSKLFLLAPEGMARERALEVFSSQGSGPERIEFTATLPRPEYLKNYHRIDVGLDTVPYNGHTTSLDSYWMGVPVVTLVGSTVVGRAGLSQLSNLQLPELIAHTPEQFVEIAAGLARDIPRLTQLRATLRGRLQDSPLMNAKLFARNIEAAYRQVWRERP